MPPRKSPPVVPPKQPDWAIYPEVFKRKSQSLPKEIEEHVYEVSRNMTAIIVKTRELANMYKSLDPKNPNAIDAYVKKIKDLENSILDDVFTDPVDTILKREGGVIY